MPKKTYRSYTPEELAEIYAKESKVRDAKSAIEKLRGQISDRQELIDQIQEFLDGKTTDCPDLHSETISPPYYD